jgi:hypothetical protein
VIRLDGPDIYHTTTVSREVYSFGVAIDDPDTSFALTADEIKPQLDEATNTVPVATGRDKC